MLTAEQLLPNEFVRKGGCPSLPVPEEFCVQDHHGLQSERNHKITPIVQRMDEAITTPTIHTFCNIQLINRQV